MCIDKFAFFLYHILTAVRNPMLACCPNLHDRNACATSVATNGRARNARSTGPKLFATAKREAVRACISLVRTGGAARQTHTFEVRREPLTPALSLQAGRGSGGVRADVLPRAVV